MRINNDEIFTFCKLTKVTEIYDQQEEVRYEWMLLGRIDENIHNKYTGYYYKYNSSWIGERLYGFKLKNPK